MKKIKQLLLILPALTLLSYGSLNIASDQRAYAGPCCSCVCNDCVRPAHLTTRAWITLEFTSHENWLLRTLWYDNVLPAMMMMTNQMSAVAMQQVQIIGAFMDAKMQMETQQLLQQLQAEAHKDYHPSEELCSIGTGVRSLAASERKGELTASVISKRMIDRHMRNENTATSDPAKDIQSRIDQFASRYCNRRDLSGALATSDLCDGSTNSEFHNKDIDFTRTIDIPLTLDVDFSANIVATPGGPATVVNQDEQDVLAMATNLFGHEILTANLDLSPDSSQNDKENFLDYRSVLAKRSVAQNSFNTIIGLKSSGSGIGTVELNAILEELGVPAAEVTEILGENPSYYAQMELLTKKVFQNPSFYINLYDKPANVNRKAVALQALQLMLLNDTYNSNLRTEMIMAVALERELERAQEGLQSRIQEIR